jgi:integral membrane protein
LSAGPKGRTDVRAALTRYRVIAYVVGVVLIVLVVIGMPLKYLADNPAVVETVGPAHGFLYMLYLVAVFDLGRRARWPLGRMVLVMLAGTVPFVSFYAERVVTRWLTQGEPAPANQAASPAPETVVPRRQQ